MTAPYKFDPDTEWLDHIRPTGLVVARAILKELGLVPLHQTPLDSNAAARFIAYDRNAPALPDPWAFTRHVLEWPADRIAGAPGGPPLPERLAVSVPEHGTVLTPEWAVLAEKDSERIQLLVQLVPSGIDPDGRGTLQGWEASAHQRFERLLRETRVFTGVLVSDRELRLVHAPGVETSGWLSFPLHDLGSVPGRTMLGGLKLLLDRASLFTNPENKRLPVVLAASRAAQASVSQELAGQVLGALHELLRGLIAADATEMRRLAAEQPRHLYEGLLTVLMRLVFLLYAEDRGLLPSQQDEAARALYDENYSLRGLFARLTDDAARHPDTMDERRGAWGQLLALFRLIHMGDGSGWIVGRGGKLFDPDVFPLLEGRKAASDPARVLPVTDGCVLRLLQDLMTLDGERLSYRTLDVEQIGSVYETVMGFTVEAAAGPSIAIRAGKNNQTPVFVDCDVLAKIKIGERQKTLKDLTGRSQFPAAVATEIKAASDASAIAAAFGNTIDRRGSPDSAPVAKGTPILQPTEERRRTGSHYTPRELTEPIVRQALAPMLECLGDAAPPAAILDIKVCDPAMGSGAFLVEACRQLGTRLVKAWASPGPRPAIPPDETEELHARRLVAQRCLYGVDRNPMAADLARLSLWLATLARDHEFTFLDHALKSGDSLIGLNRAQIAAAHWDTDKPGLPLLRSAVQDRIGEALRGRAEIRDAPDDVQRAIQEFRFRTTEGRVERVRQAGDAIVGAFFSTDKDNARETRRAEIESWFAGGNDVWAKVAQAAAELQQGPRPLRPFHWEIEFPEVFARDNPGFDAIVGNPPFLRGKGIGTQIGEMFRDWLTEAYPLSNSSADLASFFFRRAFEILRNDGTLALIATKTISQGATRRSGLRYICKNGGTIYRVRRRMRWPGEASVSVSIVHIIKGLWKREKTLDDEIVDDITAFFFRHGGHDDPQKLQANSDLCFNGCAIAGVGFTFDDTESRAGKIAEMHSLIEKDPANGDRIFPFIGGDEINGNPTIEPVRYIIFFNGMELSDTNRWPDLQRIVRERVKPERDAANRKAHRERWWQFGDWRPGLFQAISGLDRMLCVVFVSQYLGFSWVPTNRIVSHNVGVFATERDEFFCIVQSRVHEYFATQLSSGLEERPGYRPSDGFEPFPFPEDFKDDRRLAQFGKAYHDLRSGIMLRRGEGLTRLYTRFHNQLEQAPDIVRLRELHAEMDDAVLRAYGWSDLAERARPIFIIEQESEEEAKAKTRLDWPSEFRDEVLARLLALNAERYADEQAAGPTPATKKPRKPATVAARDRRQTKLL